MAYVKARPGESVDSLLKRFKKAVDNSGILTDLKKSEFYEKPSVRQKKKKIAAIKRAAKNKVSEKPRNINFKWNKDHTKKIPLVNEYKGNKNSPTNNNYKGNRSNSTSNNYKGTKPSNKKFNPRNSRGY